MRRIFNWCKLLLMVTFFTPMASANQNPTAIQVATNCSSWNKNLNCSMTNQQLVDNALDQLTAGGGGSQTPWTQNINGGGYALSNATGNISMWTNNVGYLTGITSGQVTGALGYTPYNATNPSNYLSTITASSPLSGAGTSGSPLVFTNPGYITNVGIGTANTIAYWVDSSDIGSLNTSTYPSLTELSYVKGVTSSIQTQLNSKGTGNGTVTEVKTASPLIGDITASGTLGIGTATTSNDGYLTHTDWNTFNNKQSAGAYLLTVSTTAPIQGNGTSALPLGIGTATSTTDGYLLHGDWNTFNSKGSGTVTSVATTNPITGGTITGTGTIGINTTGPWNGIPAGLVAVSPITFNPANGNVGINTATTWNGNAVTSTNSATTSQIATLTNNDWCTSNGATIACTNATPQANLSLAAGTYINGDACTYASSGTLLNCNTALTNGTVTSIATTAPITGGTISTTGTIGIGTAYPIISTGGLLGINTTGPWNGNAVTATTAGTVTTAAQPNITSVGTLTSLTVSGNIGVGTVNAVSITLPGGAQGQVIMQNGVGLGTWSPISTSGSGSGTVNSGVTGQVAYYASSTTAVSGSSSMFISGSTSGNNVGIGSAVPGALLDVQGTMRALNYGTYEKGITNYSNNIYLYNFDALHLPKTRAAISRVQANAGNGLFLFIGDSTTYGTGAGSSSGTGVTGYINSYPHLLATDLSNLGIPSNNNAWFGSSKSAETRSAIDGRITMTGGWGDNGESAVTVGGGLYDTTTTGTFTFTPDQQVDTVKTWYAVFSSGNTANFSLGNGSITQVNSTGSASIGETTVTNTLSSQSMNVAWVSGSGGNFSIMGQEAYNSKQSQIIMMNAGWYGALSADQAGNASNFSTPHALTSLTPDLVVLNIFINDANDGTSISTFSTNVQQLITWAISNGSSDVLIMTNIPSNPGSYASTPTQLTYQNVLYSLAQSNNIALIDVWQRWYPWSTSNTENYYYSDGLHPSGTGYADEARWLAAELNSL